MQPGCCNRPNALANLLHEDHTATGMNATRPVRLSTRAIDAQQTMFWGWPLLLLILASGFLVRMATVVPLVAGSGLCIEVVPRLLLLYLPFSWWTFGLVFMLILLRLLLACQDFEITMLQRLMLMLFRMLLLLPL